MARALRAMFLACDGTSVGHVTRSLALARALIREGGQRGIGVKVLMATTSEAEGLLAWSGIPSLRLPAPARAFHAGWEEAERVRLVAAALEAAADAFAPDLLVADTFPSGPHGEAARLLPRIPHRILVRRTVRPERAHEPPVRAGLDQYRMVIVPADPGAPEGPLDPVHRLVPPMTLLDPPEILDRETARAELGLAKGPTALVTTGGGGDPASRDCAAALADAIARDGRFQPYLAHGVLAPGKGPAPVPLQRRLRGFDVALAGAGYNTAHELALAGVPSALTGCPRAYDDQEARARRFESAGLAIRLDGTGTEEVRRALDRLVRFRPAVLPTGGATSAAHAILDDLGAALSRRRVRSGPDA